MKRNLVGSLTKISAAVLFVVSAISIAFGAGEVDSGFNPQLTRNINSNISGKLALQPDGKIIIYGAYTDSSGTTTNTFVKRINADGTPDASFSCSVCGAFYPYSAAVQPDGKIILGGFTTSLLTQTNFIVRLNSDGSQDNSFVAPNISGATDVIVIQPDGKIIIKYRTSFQGSSQETIKRLNADGSYDTGFTTIVYSQGRNYQNAAAVLLLPGGKFLVGGGYTGIGSTAFLYRYNADGTLDNTFETPTFADGRDNRSYIGGLALQSDGSILVSGDFTSVNGISRIGLVRLFPAGNVDTSFAPPIDQTESGGKIYVLPNGKFIATLVHFMFNTVRAARFNADGTLDSTFNQAPGFNISGGLAIDDLGRVVFFGIFDNIQRYARLNTDGSLDATFNPPITVNGTVSTLFVQPDGKIIISGNFDKTNNNVRNKISRVNADGTLDTTFDSGSGFDTAPNIVTVQADGKILVGGDFTIYNGVSRTRIARLDADGSLDTAFNPTINSTVYAVVPLPNGKIMIGGNFSTVNGATRTGIARLNSDGSLDTSLNTQFGSFSIRAILVLTDGKLMIGGSFSGVNGFNRANFARLNSDGSLDTGFNAGSISPVYRIIPQSDGKFTVLQPTTIARRNADGTADDSFQSPSVAGTINEMIQQADGSIIIGGEFSSVNNINRKNLARLTANGAFDQLFFQNGTNGAINAIAGQTDGKIIVGGNFSLIENVLRTGIARITATTPRSITKFDYDGDGKADISVFRPSENRWYILRSSDYQVAQTFFGLSGDVPAPADFDGDGKTDPAIFRPSTGDWWYQSSISNAQISLHWGQAGDIPRPSDFDGDGKTDYIVYRPSNSVWYRYGSGGQTSILQFGLAEDKPLVGDFDGDGKSDVAIFRPSTGDWWYAPSSVSGQFASVHWGANGDIPVPADYDGDGKTDLAVFRPSEGGWYVLKSTGGYTIATFGRAGDQPIAADYDGDGKADIAVFRPSDRTWYLMQTVSGFGAIQFGISTDIPTENAFLR